MLDRHAAMATRKKSGPLPDLERVVLAAKLDKIPTDPFSDKPLRMTTIDGQPVIYSVGIDGKDDEGRVKMDYETKQGDLLFQLPVAKSANFKETKPDPREDLKTAIPAAIEFLEDNDYESFLKRFTPPKDLDRILKRRTIEDLAKDFSDSKFSDSLLKVLNVFKGAVPNLAPGRESATIVFKKPVDGHRYITFLKVGKYWYVSDRLPDRAITAIKKWGGRSVRRLNGDVYSVLLSGSQVGDVGLVVLNKMVHLRRLALDNTQVTDAGMVHLEKLTNLTRLHLFDTKVTDAGLEHLKGLINLKRLSVTNTKVTEGGMKNLKESLPQCCVFNDTDGNEGF